jgi:Bacterial virulence factor lipase N-terminal
MAKSLVRGAGILLLALAGHHPQLIGKTNLPRNTDVFALFDLGAPEGGPFPSDIFTVEEAGNNTGRRLAYPYPDCTLRPSDCDDLDVVNTLDGWGLQTRVSVPFSGEIDPGTVTSDSIFVVSLGSTLPGNPPGGERIGINQVVWDVATHTLYFEVDRLLDQHRRYGVIVTRDVLDARGKHVKKTAGFENHATATPPWYAAQIDEALAAAHALGVPPRHVVTAAVFTTQTITSVMERIRDDIKAAIPAPADFLLGPAGERTVFNRADVKSVVFKQQTKVSSEEFLDFPVNIPQLDAVSGAVGTIAYGRYVSPDYLLHPGEYIPAVGTRADTPPVQGYATVYFTLYLPSGPKPPGGWPILLTGGGTSTNQHFLPTNFASKMASHGIATIGISQVGQGFGPLGRLVVTTADATMLAFLDAGRGVDQNGDGTYSPLEGSEAAAPRTWTISSRDTYRQFVIDLMQLVRVIQVGMDVDGDWVSDIDPTRVYYLGASAGTMMGASFVALDPAVSVAAFVSAPGVIPEHARWQPVRRSAIGMALEARTPSLVNAEGLTSIDGVPVSPPHFNENKPLRDLPVLINTIAGAIDIQRTLEWAEMAAEAGISAVPWAKYMRAQPLPGSSPKSILYQLAKGDQQAVNPGMSALIREGNLADRTTFYRHDLAFEVDPTIPTNPHTFAAQPTSPNATVRAISLGAQEQLAVFFASHGAMTIDAMPKQYFEVPIISPLPEDLNFIREPG